MLVRGSTATPAGDFPTRMVVAALIAAVTGATGLACGDSEPAAAAAGATGMAAAASTTMARPVMLMVQPPRGHPRTPGSSRGPATAVKEPLTALAASRNYESYRCEIGRPV